MGGSINIAPCAQSFFVLKDRSKLTFKGNAIFSEGISIRVNSDASLIIGNNFSANRNLIISSERQVSIGDDVLFGWNVLVQDDDGHQVIYSTQNKENKKIDIGDNVWVASYCHILGGTDIGKNSVVAMNSLCNRKYESNNLIGGTPAKQIKKIKGWNR